MRSALRLLLVAFGSCAYAGLAVLGWGGFLSFFSHPAFIALVVVLLALSVVASFAGGNLSAGVREARGNRWVIPVLVIIGFLNAHLPAYTDRRGLWTIDGDRLRWVGVALFAAGGALRIWPVFLLGLLMNSLGWSLAFRSGVGVLLTVLLILPLLARISAKENLLRSQFGNDYNRYRSHTWRLIPGIY